MNLNENSSEEEQLSKILELRLAGVKPQYRDDVFKRKMTIIMGEGVVHGSRRNLPEEYCYDSNIISPN